jgi:hypothetical protein
MTPWDFVTLAYALTGLATCALVGQSWWAMRRAEAAAEAAKPRR